MKRIPVILLPIFLVLGLTVSIHAQLISPERQQRAVKPGAAAALPDKPDLIVEYFNLVPLDPTPADNITFTAVVKNTGNGPAGQSKLSLRVGGETVPPKYEVPSLAPGARYIIQRTLKLNVAQGYLAEAKADVDNVVGEANEANNSKTLSFMVIKNSPDLVVESFTMAPLNPTTLDSISFTAVVANIGKAGAGPSKISLRVGGETVPPKYEVPPLPPGGHHVQQRTVKLDVAQGYIAEAKADVDNVVEEANEANNSKTLSFVVSPGGPDLVVDYFDLVPPDPTTRDSIIVMAVVRNIGSAPSGPSKLSLRVGGETYPPKYEIPGLAAGERFTVQRNVKLTVAQGYMAEARADADNTVPDVNKGNNSKILTFSVKP